MKRNEIIATVVWVAIGLALVIIFNFYPQIKFGIVFAVFIIGIAIYRFLAAKKTGRKRTGKRSETAGGRRELRLALNRRDAHCRRQSRA
jgi:hypothetical protein